MNRKYCLTLNLRNDPDSIRQYEAHHKKVWPEIIKSIRDAGIESMEIYRLGTRLFMIMEVGPGFSFEKKAAADSTNAMVQKWESLMWKYQQPLEEAREGEKWMLMDKIFDLNEVHYVR
jgi:L-rhamnose mutarotase